MVKDLALASASINTIIGEVSCSGERSDREVKLEVALPVRSEAVIYLPLFRLRKPKLQESGTLIEDGDRALTYFRELKKLN